MRNLLCLVILVFLSSCSNSKSVYWCGDHPCINKKEKESYFKKTMIVEVKSLEKNSREKNSEIEKILQQASLNEKKRINEERDMIKQLKLEEKMKIKKQKELIKQSRIKEKKIAQDEKKLAKQIEHDQKKKYKDKYKNVKKNKKVIQPSNNTLIDSSNF